MKPLPLLLSALCLVAVPAHAQRAGGRAFSAPNAKLQYAPDRDYDLQHLKVELTVDWANRSFNGITTNTLAPLRNGLRVLHFHAGRELEIKSATLAGQAATFTRDGEWVLLAVPAPLPKDKSVVVVFQYKGGSVQGAGFGAGNGFHWLNPTETVPQRIGFWTQGETTGNRHWAVTWDYPNDMTTTETITTVPADWTVVGNGVVRSDTVKGSQRTVRWEMTQPHATYLLSLAAGPFDVKKDKWRDVPLWYVVPRGQGWKIEASFGDTPDMLEFFSTITGVKYAWPKYAQDAMYDFGGGMENVSATTLGAGQLTDFRDGFRRMASLNSHELAHQWFGDLVTCKDWGEAWLNESFATLFETLYFEHSRGKNAYDQEIENNLRSYLAEAGGYKRPISTNFYSGPDAMFDQHTYPKGGNVLHTLRRWLGDEAFFAGIKKYLTEHRHQPVEWEDLCRAFTDVSGINCEPFFQQWILKPGHPVLEYRWTYDEAAKEVVLAVQQTQDTSDGTPIYTIPAKVGILAGGLRREAVTLEGKEQTLRFKADRKPDAVLLDPDHDFLRELRHDFAKEELLALVQWAPVGVDKNLALRGLLAEGASDEAVRIVAAQVAADKERFPAIGSLFGLGQLAREDLRPLWRGLLTHASETRRGDAIRALGRLKNDPSDAKALIGMLSEKETYVNCNAIASTLVAWDESGYSDAIAKARKLATRAVSGPAPTGRQGAPPPPLRTPGRQ